MKNNQQSTMEDMRTLCKKCLYLGLDLSFHNKVFVTKFHSDGVIKRYGYQVHTEYRKPYSRIFNNIEDAVNKFIELCR